MSDETFGIAVALIIAIFLLIALIGVAKPLYRRFTGKSEGLKKQDEQLEAIKRQNELLQKMLEKDSGK